MAVTLKNALKNAIVTAVFIMAAFAMRGVEASAATTFYEGVDAYNSGTAYTDVLTSYVVGESTDDFDKEFRTYRTYLIRHDGNNVVKQMKLKKGALHVVLYGFEAATGSVTIYSDSACTKSIAKMSLTNNSVMTENGTYNETTTFDIPKTQTYFVEFASAAKSPATYQFSTQQYDGSNRIMPLGKIMGYASAPNSATYYRIDAEESCYVTIKAGFYRQGRESDSDKESLTVSLTDKYKKNITKVKTLKASSSDELNADTVVYAMKSGTYYLKVDSDDQRIYTLSCKQSDVKILGGSSINSAKKIKFNKWYKSLAVWESTTSQASYFKFTLNKPSKVYITLDGSCCSGKIIGSSTGDSIRGSCDNLKLKGVKQRTKWNIHTTSVSRLPKGTYYIKLSKDTKKTNGYYRLKITTK